MKPLNDNMEGWIKFFEESKKEYLELVEDMKYEDGDQIGFFD